MFIQFFFLTFFGGGQYAHYESIKVTPVAKAIVPILSTVGGEEGGRAPIVIEDKNIQAAAPHENVETMADPGKAEPGRDIFAGEPVNDIKSSNIPVQPPEPVREQKEISSVNVGTMSSSSTSTSSSSDGTAEEPSGSATSTVAASETATTQSDAATIIESSSVAAAAAVKVQVAGPLREAELEAQKVANELYPDAEN